MSRQSNKLIGVVAALVCALSGATGASAATVVVNQSNLNGWDIANFDSTLPGDTAPPGTPTAGGADGDFVTGPGTPPAGTGSFHEVIGPNGDDATRIRTSALNGTLLTALTDISYSTYVTANVGGQATYIQLRIDLDGNGTTDDILFFEPVYQNGSYSTLSYSGPIPNQCPGNPPCVTLGIWQAWDADAGGWWSNNDSAGGPPLTTLAGYAANYPGAKLATDFAAVRLTAGFGAGAWDNFDGNVDDFTIGGTTYDFELTCGTRFVATTGSDTSNDCTSSGSPCQTIQHAVDAACDGDTIEVTAGTYAEQVKITKNGITVNGNGATVKPTTVVSGTDQGSPCSGGTGTAIVLVSGVTGVTLNDLNVDGQPAGGASPPRYVGIYYRNASGAINGGTVQDIRDNPLDGVQNGLGILAQANSPNTATLAVDGVTVTGYQKNGVTFNGCGCADTPDGVATGSLTNSTITGAGPTNQIAQNGVQVGFGAGPVTISGNHISGDAYTGDPNNGTGAGVLLFSTKNDLVTGNVITSSNNGVAIAGGDFSLCSPGDSTGHVVTCNSIRGNAINNTVGSPAAGPGVLSDAANNTVNMNVIRNNELGADGTAITSGQLNAEDNWWGCVGGPGTFGCDTVAGNVDFTPFLTEPPACVPDTEELNVTKLRFMRSTLPSGDNSNIFGKGDFIAGTPTEVTGAGGVTIRIQDSFGTDKTHTFATCTTTPVRVRCVETNHSIMDIKAFGNPLTHRIKFKVKQLGLTGPFNGPATVTLSYSTLERVGVISDCQVRASGLLCRQF